MLQIFRVFTLGMAGLIAAVSPAKPVAVHHFTLPAAHVAAERIDADQQVRLLQEQQAVEQIRVQQEAEAKAAEEQRARDAEAAAASAQSAAVQSAAAQNVAAQRPASNLPAAQAPAAPVQAQPPANYGGGTVQDIIRAAFAPYGPAAVDWGLRVARCESGYNPRAVNGAGPYYGLFQFLTSTFRSTPYGGGDIFDAATNARAAAWKYANGGAGAWGCN